MTKYNLFRVGSVDDARSSLRLIEKKASVQDLNKEVEAEMKNKCRASLINLINAAITRKMKKGE